MVQQTTRNFFCLYEQSTMKIGTNNSDKEKILMKIHANLFRKKFFPNIFEKILKLSSINDYI